MRRSTLRLVALLVLALLGAPVAMHVVMHDLHDHHEDHAEPHDGGMSPGDHEHPIVSSSAPEVPSLSAATLPVAVAPYPTAAIWNSTARSARNALAHGALRSDEDVGLQPLLATFLI